MSQFLYCSPTAISPISIQTSAHLQRHWSLFLSSEVTEAAAGAIGWPVKREQGIGPCHAVCVYGRTQPSSGESPQVHPYSKLLGKGAHRRESAQSACGKHQERRFRLLCTIPLRPAGMYNMLIIIAK